ncbi:MAG: glycosyltransferase [Bacteroidales bacterium]
MKKIFLLNTITAWDEPPRARHQLTFSLAKNHHVIFIARNKTGFPKINVYTPQENITVIEPVFPIDYKYRYRLPIINEIYQNWLFNWISKNISYDQSINFDFTATLIYNYIKKTIYYCNDEYIGNSKYPVWIINKYHQRCENIVIKKALFCIVTSRFLETKFKLLNQNTFLIPLGGPNSSDIKVTPGKSTNNELITVNLTYVGARNLDFLLINDLLLKENIFVQCIGPRDAEFERKIIKHKNIVFKGILKGVDLYREINKADVGIAPYDIAKVNKGGTPNKLWQYFALGKPVVVSDLPNLAFFDFPDKFIYTYISREDCYKMIIKAHSENNDNLVESRSKFADLNSWDKRSEEFMKLADSFFHSENPG